MSKHLEKLMDETERIAARLQEIKREHPFTGFAMHITNAVGDLNQAIDLMVRELKHEKLEE